LSNHIAFIGAGTMATSLINGLISSGHDPSKIAASDPQTTILESHQARGVTTSTINDDVVRYAEVIVLAVKPQVIGKVLTELTELSHDQLIVSLAAGVPIPSLQLWTHVHQPIVRCMPNTPALLGAGMTALFANEHTSTEQRTRVEALLSAVGRTLWVDDESSLDAVTAVSGSGPAYFFYLMEAMIAAGCSLGLDEETATTLTLETAYGAALMARESGTEPAELRANVTSPGGTTARALSILDAADCRGIITAALRGAAERAQELALEFGNEQSAK
jgi:pyrroline-5-carboxylate reductase